VREDQAFAEAMAIALQDAGLNVSRSASVMDAIDASPAVVVLWTPASSRSRLFLDAADRAFRAGKMVLARLGGAPAPADYNAALQHSFQYWAGDPDQPELAVVIGHVRRMVEFSRSRAAVGGGAGIVHPFPGASGRSALQAAPQFPPPFSPQPPPQYQPQTPQPAARAPPPPEGRMMEEVAFWKRVDSRGDAESYRTYLDYYGPHGAFADLATARLRALTSPPQPPAPPPMPTPPMPNPMAPPPYRAPGYAARPAPPPIGRPPVEPSPGDRLAPGRLAFDRAPPFDQAPASERGPRRDAPLVAAPPKSGGGIGAVLFLLILGGLAAGGWFVHNGGSFFPPPPREGQPPRTIAPIKDGPIQAPGMAPDAGPRSGAREPSPSAATDPPAARTAAPSIPRQPAAPPARPAGAANRPAADDPANRAYVPPPAPPAPGPSRSEAQDSLLRELEEVQDGIRPPPSTTPPR
jgi:hypothetical protein